jgi:hypothetical protein
MTGLSWKEELERRLAQVRRLSKEVHDPMSKERLDRLTGDLEVEHKKQQKLDEYN